MSTPPKGWVDVQIQQVAEVNPRRSVDLSLSDLVTFVPMSALDEVSGTILDAQVRPLGEVARGFTQFAENDVIFAKITPSMENGKAAVATGLVNGIAFGSTEFHVLRATGAIRPEYLWRFLRQPRFREAAKGEMTGAVGQQRVPANFLKSQRIPLPPLQEQDRLTARLRGMTNRLTATAAVLAHIPGLVAKYRSSVLGLAFSGKLTADLRMGVEHDESGLPSTWEMQSLGAISEIQSGIQVGKRRSREVELVEVPYLRVANVQRGWLDLEEVKTIPITYEEKERLLLRYGDILMNEGGDRDKLGRGWLWEEQLPECIHQNHVFRIRLKPETLPPAFVSFYANERGQQYFFDQGTQTTNLASISKRKVSALPLPMPPFEEALEIVRRIEIAFGWLDRLCSDHSKVCELVSRLEMAIVTKAFRGGLVAQDSSEEPAAELLERITIERAAQAELEPLPKRSHPISPERKQSMKSLEEVLGDSGGWISAQSAFRNCGYSDAASTEEVERFYIQLRALGVLGKLDVEPILDVSGFKVSDRIRLKTE